MAAEANLKLKPHAKARARSVHVFHKTIRNGMEKLKVHYDAELQTLFGNALHAHTQMRRWNADFVFTVDAMMEADGDEFAEIQKKAKHFLEQTDAWEAAKTELLTETIPSHIDQLRKIRKLAVKEDMSK